MGVFSRTLARLAKRTDFFSGIGPLGGLGGLEAGSIRRWTLERTTALSSPAAFPSLNLVRIQSVAATVNKPYMARAVDAWITALIGAGIVAASSHADPALRKLLQTGFAAWAQHCEADGRLDWPGVQAAAVREMVVAGEAFVHLRLTPDGLRLQLIPAELVDYGMTADLPGGGYIQAGIEFNAAGQRVAYHVYPRRPDQMATIGPPIRLPAVDVLHLYKPLAAGQVRGIPWAAPVLLTLNELDGLLDALIVAARVSAMHAGFLTDMNGTGAALPYDGQQVGSVLESGLEPGTMKVLPSGFDIKFSQPQQAAQAVELAKLTLRSIAMGMGLPDHVLSGDMSGANYSSLRAALVEWRQRIEQLQFNVIIPQLIRPVFQRWVELAVMAGDLDEAATAAAEFYPPQQPWVDPVKDAEAEAVLIAAGLKSRRQAVAQQGYDVEALDAEIAADHAREKALGLSFTRPVLSPSVIGAVPEKI